MSDISYYTNAELIEELTKRSTFAGVVLHSEKELRNSDNASVDQKWDITYCKLSELQVSELLQSAVEHFRELAESNGE